MQCYTKEHFFKKQEKLLFTISIINIAINLKLNIYKNFEIFANCKRLFAEE